VWPVKSGGGGGTVQNEGGGGHFGGRESTPGTKDALKPWALKWGGATFLGVTKMESLGKRSGANPGPQSGKREKLFEGEPAEVGGPKKLHTEKRSNWSGNGRPETVWWAPLAANRSTETPHVLDLNSPKNMGEDHIHQGPGEPMEKGRSRNGGARSKRGGVCRRLRKENIQKTSFTAGTKGKKTLTRRKPGTRRKGNRLKDHKCPPDRREGKRETKGTWPPERK